MKFRALTIRSNPYTPSAFTANLEVENLHGSTTLKLDGDQIAAIMALVAEQLAENVTQGMHALQDEMRASVDAARALSAPKKTQPDAIDAEVTA
jgi:hypothetical protein